MVKGKKKQAKNPPKECVFSFAIHLRHLHTHGDLDGPRYSLRADCLTHEAAWIGLCETIQEAEHLAEVFPLVHGGLAMSNGHEADPVHRDCILAKIRHVPWRAKP